MADNCAKGRRQHKFTTVQQLMTTAFQALFTFASAATQFWCIRVSSGELSCSPAMQNCV